MDPLIVDGKDLTPLPLVQEADDELGTSSSLAKLISAAPSMASLSRAGSDVSDATISNVAMSMSIFSSMSSDVDSMSVVSGANIAQPTSSAAQSDDEAEPELGESSQSPVKRRKRFRLPTPELREIDDADLSKKLTIVLTESPTMVLFEQQCNIFSIEEPEVVARVTDSNQRYQAKRETYQQSADMLTDREVQCLHFPMVPQHVQTITPRVRDREVTVDEYDIFTAVAIPSKEKTDEEEKRRRDRKRRARIAKALADGDDEEDQLLEADWREIRENVRFKEHLYVFENILSTELYKRMLDQVRRFEPSYIDELGDMVSDASCSNVITLRSEQARGKLDPAVLDSEDEQLAVMAVALNPVNQTLFAVGLGNGSYSGVHNEGVVLLWTMRNLLSPERVYKFPSSVLSVAFSKTRPYLLAVGMLNGNVEVVDILQEEKTVIFSTDGTENRSSDAIWGMDFVDTMAEHTSRQLNHVLYVSADGGCRLFDYEKGKINPIVFFKPVKNPERAEDKSEGFITRRSSPFSLTTDPNDSTIYLVGMLDGLIHRCSRTFTENYLNTYVGHTEPVYAVRFCPFSSNYFVSCSEDWRILIWNVSERSPVMVLEPSEGQSAVLDVDWCPHNSRILASVSRSGHIFLFDIDKDSRTALFHQKHPYISAGVHYTSVQFSKELPLFVVGDSMGDTHLFKVKGISSVEDRESDEIQVELLENAIQRSAALPGASALG